MQTLDQQVHQYEKGIVEIRRKIHANPELSYKEIETARLVAEELGSLGIEVQKDVGGTGVVGILRGLKQGKVIALRADMDALPVNEDVEVPFKSKKSGVMHACGHDAHVAMLLGAATLLKKNVESLYGAVKFIFQPAEEAGGRGGALPMIEAGVMTNPKVDFVFGLHILTNFPVATFALRSGPIMAAPDSFRIKVYGKGGHGSEPHKTIDPIFVSSQIISALQGVSSRMVDQTKPFVVSVCNMHSGSMDNVIPSEAVLEGTMRTLDERLRSSAKKHIVHITKSICKAFGARCQIEFKKDTYPITLNNPRVARRVREILSTIEGTRTVECDPILGSEDISRFLQKAPGAYYFLGTLNKKKDCTYPNHSSQFKLDEDVLKFGAVSLAKLAIEFGRG